MNSCISPSLLWTRDKFTFYMVQILLSTLLHDPTSFSLASSHLLSFQKNESICGTFEIQISCPLLQILLSLSSHPSFPTSPPLSSLYFLFFLFHLFLLLFFFSFSFCFCHPSFPCFSLHCFPHSSRHLIISCPPINFRIEL